MEAKEFKEKFKAGDKVCGNFWGKKFVTILYIGKDRFFSIYSDGYEVSWSFNDENWQHYEEPVKKDLEGVRSWVLVSKDFSGVRVDVLYSDENYIKYLKTTHINIQEIITIEEAIERGLKL